MKTITADLPDELVERLEHLQRSGSENRNDLIRMAVELFLEEEEDYRMALAEKSKNEPLLSLEEVKKNLGLDY